MEFAHQGSTQFVTGLFSSDQACMNFFVRWFPVASSTSKPAGRLEFLAPDASLRLAVGDSKGQLDPEQRRGRIFQGNLFLFSRFASREIPTTKAMESICQEQIKYLDSNTV
eukprot:752822-Hanusia_phi.AAC.1